MEAATFVVFLLIQVGAHHAPRITGLAVFKKIQKHHWAVWVLHPTVLHTTYDYSLHLADVLVHTFYH